MRRYLFPGNSYTITIMTHDITRAENSVERFDHMVNRMLHSIPVNVSRRHFFSRIGDSLFKLAGAAVGLQMHPYSPVRAQIPTSAKCMAPAGGGEFCGQRGFDCINTTNPPGEGGGWWAQCCEVGNCWQHCTYTERCTDDPNFQLGSHQGTDRRTGPEINWCFGHATHHIYICTVHACTGAYPDQAACETGLPPSWP